VSTDDGPKFSSNFVQFDQRTAENLPALSASFAADCSVCVRFCMEFHRTTAEIAHYH